MPDGPIIRGLLQFKYGGAALAVAAGRRFRQLGAGGEWNVFGRHVNPHAQPRAHVAAASAADLAAGGDKHGNGHYPGTERRRIARGTVEISGRILRDLYHGMLPAV